MYLTSPGRPADIGLNWAMPAILVAGEGRGGRFLFLLFLHFHSFSFLPCPSFISSTISSKDYLFSPLLWEMTQNVPQGLMCG